MRSTRERTRVCETTSWYCDNYQNLGIKNPLGVVISTPPGVGGVARSAEVVRKAKPGDGTKNCIGYYYL